MRSDDPWGRRPSGWPELLVGLTISLLVASLAINWSMQLIQEVWVPLVICGSVVLVLVVTGMVLWRRWNRW